MQSYRTSQIAKPCCIHPNTVRLYEDLQFIPPVPRSSNGYRQYTKLHLEHVILVRLTLNSTWLGGDIRLKAMDILYLSANSQYDQALNIAQDHLALIKEERQKAEIAADLLEEWAACSNEVELDQIYYKPSEVIDQLSITNDMIRSWERNGLLTVSRNPQNNARMFRPSDIDRLYIIRALRKARFNLSSIHRMLQQYDQGVRKDLANYLNDLPYDEEDIVYSTDQWLIKVKTLEVSAYQVIDQLTVIKNLAESSISL